MTYRAPLYWESVPNLCARCDNCSKDSLMLLWHCNSCASHPGYDLCNNCWTSSRAHFDHRNCMRFYDTGPTVSGRITVEDVDKEMNYFICNNDEVSEEKYVVSGCDRLKALLRSGGELRNAIVHVKDSKGRYRMNFCTSPCDSQAKIYIAEPNSVSLVSTGARDRQISPSSSLGMAALLSAVAQPRTQVRTQTRMEMRNVQTPFGSMTSLRMEQVRQVRRVDPLARLMAGLAIASLLDDDDD